MRSKTKPFIKTLFLCLVIILIHDIYAQTNSPSFRFTVTGDPRNELTKWEHTLEQMTEKVNGEGAFHITAGDYYQHGALTIASDFYDIMKLELGDDVVWYPTVGNHETQEDSKDVEWLRQFYYDHLEGKVNPGPPNGVETTYSFDFMNVHFVQLNQYYDGQTDKHGDAGLRDDLYNWLVADLERNTKPLIFVIYHAPFFPEGRGGKEMEMPLSERDRFWNLLKEYKVTAGLCAHSHIYAKGLYGNNPFTWEIDVGNAGRQSHADPYQTFLDVTVTDLTVRFDVWQGNEGEEFKITESWTVEGADIKESWSTIESPVTTETKPEELPRIIKEAIKNFDKDAELDEYKRLEDNVGSDYEVDINKDDLDIKLIISAEGNVLSIEEEAKITFEEMPSVCREILKKVESSKDPWEVRSRTNGEKTTYTVEYYAPGETIKIVIISPKGEILEIEEPLRVPDLSSDIKEKIKKLYPDYKIKDGVKRTRQYYDLTITKDGKERKVRAYETGEIENDN